MRKRGRFLLGRLWHLFLIEGCCLLGDHPLLVDRSLCVVSLMISLLEDVRNVVFSEDVRNVVFSVEILFEWIVFHHRFWNTMFCFVEGLLLRWMVYLVRRNQEGISDVGSS